MRIIPILNIIEGQLYKTRNFKNPKYVGDPVNAIRIFNDKLVDELFVLDINASKKNMEPNFSIIEKIAGECFTPLTYGGGIRDISQVKKIFSIGVDKISLQSGYFLNKNLAAEISSDYGSQAVNLSIDIRKKFSGRYLINEEISVKNIDQIINFIKDLDTRYIGELLVTSINQEGTLAGPDYNLITKLVNCVKVPIVYNGGISSLSDIQKIKQLGLQGVAVGSFFVFTGPHRAVLISYPKFEEIGNGIDD